MSTNKISMSFAASLNYRPENPERTAKKSSGFEVIFQTWTNRSAMVKTIRLQEKRAPRQDDWKALIPLSEGEI